MLYNYHRKGIILNPVLWVRLFETQEPKVTHNG